MLPWEPSGQIGPLRTLHNCHPAQLHQTSDRGIRSNDWIGGETRPQSGTKEGKDREGEARRAKDMDRMWERARGGKREVEQDQREKETTFKGSPGERQWQERERGREGRYSNGRIASVQEYSGFNEREREKGDTFPRTQRRSNERERTRLYVDQDNERMMGSSIGRLREIDKTESEREREKAKKKDRDVTRYRERERQRENDRLRIMDEIKKDSIGRPAKEELDRIRGRGWDLGRKEKTGNRDAEVNDQQIRRVREADRERDRAGHRCREEYFYPMHRSRNMEGDRGNFSDRDERDERSMAWRRERHRHTKSDGDSDGEKEREVRRKEASETLRYDQSKSERDNERERSQEKLRDRERHQQRERERGKDRDRDALGGSGRERDKEEMERYTGRYRERDQVREVRGPDRQRDAVRDTQDRRREKEPSERMRRERDRERALIYSFAAERETGMYPTQKEVVKRKSWEDEDRGRSNQEQSEVYRKVQMETQTSEEWMSGSDGGHEQRGREIKECSEEKERECVSESNREKTRSEDGPDVTRGQREGVAREGCRKEEMETEKDREREKSESKRRPQRKMWLEPRSERVRTLSLEEEFRDRERARERYAQRYKEKRTSREEGEAASKSEYETVTLSAEDQYRQLERAGEFMEDVDRENIEVRRTEDASEEPIFDNEGRLDAPWQTETEHVENNMEGSDREEERGSGNHCDSEGEEGSERDWGGEARGRVTSGDDGFVTVSSGGDEDEAEDFEDCKEFWDAGVGVAVTRHSPTKIQHCETEIETQITDERSDRTVTVFCVVGQTLPRSGSNQNWLMEPEEQEDTTQHSAWDSVGGGSDTDQDVAPLRNSESAEEYFMESCGIIGTGQTSLNHGLTLSEEGTISNDTKWEKGEYNYKTKEVASPQEFTGSVSAEKDSDSYPTESHSHTEERGYAQNNMTDEKEREKEMIHDTVEESKRYSSAPHVKWAKNVLKELLDYSDADTPSMSQLDNQTDQSRDGAPAEFQWNSESPASPLYGIIQKPRKHVTERKCIDSDLLQAKTEDTESAGHLHMKTDTQGNPVLIRVEREYEAEEEELEQLGQEKEWLEADTDEEDYYDRPLASPDLHSLSSDGEAEKEGSSKKDEKQKKKKTVWHVISSSSFLDLGNEAWGRRKGFRKTEKHNEDDERGVARDRRPRVFTTEEDRCEIMSHSFNESYLKQEKERISRTRMRNSKFYSPLMYQEYSEVAQNREILHQCNSDASSASSSPCPSPTPARRPLPPLPAVLHPISVSLHNNSRGTLAIPHHTPPRPVSPRLSKSFASSPMLWQDMPGVRNNPELKNLSEDERRLQEVRFEVVTSEASYCSSLDIVVEHFVKSKHLNTNLTTQDKSWLFSRLCEVRAISHSFFSQLEERVESDIMHFTICDIITKHCPRFRKVYVPYLTNQSYQDKTYQRLMNENIGFRNVVEMLEHSPKCQRLPFRSFLILPFQRITRLKLLVQNIVKRTAPKTKDEAEAIKAMKLLEKMIQDSNDSISQMKSIESLVSLNAKVDFECKTLPLIKQSRRLVREGLVTELMDRSLKETERSAYIHLFNDYLLLSLPKEGGRFTVIDHAPVSELRAENCRVKLHSLQENLFRLRMSRKALLLRTETQADKLRWISALSLPHPEMDLNAAQDIPQMQCIRAFVAQQPDELSLEKADVLLVHQQSSDGWVEGTRLSDRHRGWAPESHLETIHSEKARERNLLDALKITAATATV